MEVCEQELAQSVPIPTPVQSELLVMDWKNSSHIRWDRNDPGQVAAARARFDELRATGHLAYRLDASATQGEVLDAFDPNAERTVLHAPMVGG